MRTQGALTSRFGFNTRGRKHWQFASPLDSRTLSPHHSPNVQVSDSRYHYDPLGRCIHKAVTGHDPQRATSYTKSTDFLWQGLRLLSETQHQPEQPTTTRLYCYEQNSYAPLARIDTTRDDLNSPQVYYFHTNVTEVTDTNGQIVWQADYTAWDEIDLYRIHQIDQPLCFQGQDDETGLYYTTFRYYDPHAGRFTTQDPIGLAGGWNLYQYAPNPTGWADPWGLSCASSQPEKVVNRLRSFNSKIFRVGNNIFKLDKSGMKHILERHHPNYWDGSVKKHKLFLIKICQFMI